MATRLGLSVEGFEPILERIGGMESRLADLSPAFEISADLLELHVARTWATQGAYAGHPWRPLAESTARLRQRRLGYYRRAPTAGAGPRTPILVWTGRSRASFARGSQDHVRQISAASLVWGSSVPWLVYHQSTKPRTRLPRRPVLAFRNRFQARELVFQPARLFLQGVPPGAIRTVMLARLRAPLG